MIIFIYCVCLLIILTCQSSSSVMELLQNDDGYHNDSPQHINPKVECSRHKLGADIIMKCGDSGNYKTENITWEFKQYEYNLKEVHCRNTLHTSSLGSNDNWKEINFNKRRKKLTIRNSTEKNSGLYRCLFNDSITKLYIVEVITPTVFKGPTPEITSLIPTNTTVLLNSNLVIQCKITSLMRPIIRWLKECYGRCDVKEGDRCYCAVKSTESSTMSNVYLSKINIQNARKIDGGMYVCLVISSYGKDYKNVTIKIQDLQNGVNYHKSFSLLFLIPLLFILVPVIIWLCYYRKKKNSVKSLSVNQRNLIEPMISIDPDIGARSDV